MKIKRVVNGQEMEFELTSQELLKAYKEHEFNCTVELFSAHCEHNDELSGLSKEEIKTITSVALEYLYDSDSFYEAYWDMLNVALNDYKQKES